MKKNTKMLFLRALLGISTFAFIFPRASFSSAMSRLKTEIIYSPSIEVIATPNKLEELVQPKVYIPLVSASSQLPYLAYTTSWYMQTVRTETLYFLGCQLGYRDRDLSGQQDSVVILDFDYPTYRNEEYGANLFGFGPASTTALAAAVEFFGIGYYTCVQPDINSVLRIAVGTNNCGPAYCPGSAAAEQNYAHGAAWAVMLNDIGDYFIAHGYYPRVSAFGANDMEVGWNDPYTTKQWVWGYDSMNEWPLYNFGDAQGCPQHRTYYNASCDNGWYQHTIWYISWGLPASLPLPQIYDNDGANGRQWFSISAYGYDMQGGRMNIQGSITQSLACSQVGCGMYVDNTPQEGYFDLYSALNSDVVTSQTLRWSTDIGYSGY